METVYQELSQHGQVLTFIYDTLIQDNLTVDRLRSYPHPMAQRHLSNEIDATAVKTMMEVTEKNYPLAHDYFRLKAKLLELPQLALYDQYAPVGKEVRPFPYGQSAGGDPRRLRSLRPEISRSRRRIFRQELDRRGNPQRQTRRRLLRLAIAQAPSLRPVQLRRQPARRHDRRPRTRSWPARLSEPQAELF